MREVAAASMTISKVQDAAVHGPHSRVAVMVQCDFLPFAIAFSAPSSRTSWTDFVTQIKLATSICMIHDILFSGE
jgi:hypothetical protein